MKGKKTSLTRCVAIFFAFAVIAADCATIADETGNTRQGAQQFSSEIFERLWVVEKRLRNSGLPVMERTWSLEVVPGDDEAMAVQIFPQATGHMLRVFVPAKSVMRPGVLESAVGLAANALCWLGTAPSPFSRPNLPHWLTLAWKGWLETQRHVEYEHVVWRARSLGRVPKLEEILAWQDEEFSDLERDYRTAFCYWLLRSLLRKPGRADAFFVSQALGASAVGELLPRGWWKQCVEQARVDLQRSPFLGKEETRQRLLSLINDHASDVLPSPDSARTKVGKATAEIASAEQENIFPDGKKPALGQRLSRERERKTFQRQDGSAVTRKLTGRAGVGSGMELGEGGDLLERTELNAEGVESQTSRGLSARAAAREAFSASGGRLADVGPRSMESDAPTLLELARAGRNSASLYALRQARYVATGLARFGSPVYRDASARLASALVEMERRWDANVFEREMRVVLDELERIARLEYEVSAALDWAEAVFLGPDNRAAVEDYVEWRQGLERPVSLGEKIQDILMWRQRAARFSSSVGRDAD